MKRIKDIRKKLFSGKTILILLGIILIIMLITLLVNVKLIENPLKLLNKQVEIIEAKDICVGIYGKLIHSVEDEGDCQNICFAECESMQKKSKKYEFTQIPNDCNKCSCYCS